MQMVFNELSFEFPVSTLEEGKALIERFLLVYRKLVNLGVDKNLNTTMDFEGILLTENYPIEKWRNDQTIDKETLRLYKRFNDFLVMIDGRNYLSQFICENNKESLGCFIAYTIDGIVISFNCNTIWNELFIDGKIVEVKEEDIKETEVQVPNVDTAESVDFHINLIKEKIKQEKFEIKRGEELWRQRDRLFTSLIFCENVEEKLKIIEPALIKQIMKKLFMLEGYFKEWDNKSFNKNKIPNCDPESVETLRDYEEEHKFKVPDGRELTFSFHLRFTGNYEGRIYFYPDNLTGKSIIGHIGGKLPTKSWHNPN